MNHNPVPWSSFGYYLPERPSFTLDPHFHAGAYYVQEASSMFLEQAVCQSTDVTTKLNVLDLCAAPGGKSTHLLSLLNQQTLLVSNEVIRSRANILTENITKWGNPNVIVTNNEASDFQSLTGFFDLIVVDAPCSGEGLFRKDPDAMKEWSPQHVDHCYKRQRKILADIWPALKENGTLIYCTCTYNHFENEDNLKWLGQQNEIEFIDLNIPADWGIEKVEENNIKGYRFYPHRINGEGFFLSVMKKLDRSQSNTYHNRRKPKITPLKIIPTPITEWVTNHEQYLFFQWNDLISFVPTPKLNEIQLLLDHLSIVSTGTKAATVKHNKFIPEHPLAMSQVLNNDNILSLPLSLDESLNYLRKNTITSEETKKGFALVTYKSLPLGWVNVIPNRINNLYPSNWRIRMA
jgi:NOL1/NOP2/fmu family ribosome biogenesis protein